MTKIEELFRGYLLHVKLPNLDEKSVQYVEMRRAFTAGLMAFIMYDREMSEAGRSETHIENQMFNLFDECHEYWNNQVNNQ